MQAGINHGLGGNYPLWRNCWGSWGSKPSQNWMTILSTYNVHTIQKILIYFTYITSFGVALSTIKERKKIELFIIIDFRGVFTHQKGKMGYSGEIFFGGKLPNIGSKYALDWFEASDQSCYEYQVHYLNSLFSLT